EGGVVTATGADGTEYSLSIPVDALIEDTEISLTPIVGIDDLPMSGGFVAGVHFEPSGLELFRTATLSVTSPSEPDVGTNEALVGFVYDDDGENLALALTAATGNSFTVPVDHFSGAGAGAANPVELAATSTPGSPNDFIAQLMGAIQADDTEAAETILREWYETRVKPRLQAAVSNDAALERALDEYRRWLNAEHAVSLPIEVNALLSEGQELAADAFVEAIARANDLCERNASFDDAEDALRWLLRAESVLPESVRVQNGLDRSTVLVELCVQVVIESTSFPQAPVVGEPALLEVVVGFAFGDGPTEFFTGMVANVLTTGASPAGATEFTDEDGRVELTLTPDSGSVSIEIDTCIGIGGFNGGPLVAGLVCQEAFIVRGLVIDPNEAEVSPGDTVSFAALLGGSAANVTWSATGGTIDSSGLYTAGDQEGDFQVTATSADDPSLTATATVRIGADEFDPNLFRGGASGDLIDENGESYCERRGAPEGFENSCVVLRFSFNDPSFVRLEGCIVSFRDGSCSGTVSEWGFGKIEGNVFTADQHRTITFGSTVRQSDAPCPVRIELTVSPDGTQAQYSGQLKNFLANTCGPDSTTSFALVGFTKDI
ncbi:MAG: hypothetical protein JRE81_09835, partial [Deltaproteobacteria bacterium]|nr:hypothetical protein [Deltaproteobacteria bacterium]